MKAVICSKCGPPEVLQMAQVDRPAPGEHEVLVRVGVTTVTAADSRCRHHIGFQHAWRLESGSQNRPSWVRSWPVKWSPQVNRSRAINPATRFLPPPSTGATRWSRSPRLTAMSKRGRRSEM